MPIFDTQMGYQARPALGYPGQVAEGQHARDVASKRVENATVAFGVAVQSGVADDSCRVGGSGTFVGVTVSDKTRQPDDNYKVGEMAAVIRKGTVWVQVAATTAAGAPAFYTAATGALTAVAAGNVAIPNGRFETGVTGAGLVRLYLG
jgi:hypothetical protein